MQMPRRDPWAFVSLLLTICSLARMSVASSYTLGKCYCYQEWDEGLRQELATMEQTTDANHYVGVKPLTNETYEACLCSDVTRVVTLVSVRSSDWVSLAQTPASRDELVVNITLTLDAHVDLLHNENPDMEDTLVRYTNIDYANSTDDSVSFTLEAVFRSHNPSLGEQWINEEMLLLAREYMMFHSTDLPAIVLGCGDPPAAPKGGSMKATKGNLASGKAVYKCNMGYSMSTNTDEEVIYCNHDLTWTDLPADMSCIREDDCTAAPPRPPAHALNTWQTGDRHPFGSMMIYTCLEGYSDPQNQFPMPTSTCGKGSVWSPINKNLTCIHTGCLMAPPQVPDHGAIDWDHRRSEGAQADYHCQDGYKSSNGYFPRVKCTNKTWVGFPGGWQCIPLSARIPIDPSLLEPEEELNYFFVVTIPSVAGLILTIMVCLCCTRTDSPIFNICSTRMPGRGYVRQ